MRKEGVALKDITQVAGLRREMNAHRRIVEDSAVDHDPAPLRPRQAGQAHDVGGLDDCQSTVTLPEPELPDGFHRHGCGDDHAATDVQLDVARRRATNHANDLPLPRISRSNALCRLRLPEGAQRAFGSRQGLDSSIFTLRILSPGLRPSTTSIPDVTWPKTV